MSHRGPQRWHVVFTFAGCLSFECDITATSTRDAVRKARERARVLGIDVEGHIPRADPS